MTDSKRVILQFAAILVSLLAANVASAQITPTSDSYINNVEPASNHGSDMSLRIDGAGEVTYIEFPLSSIPAGALVSQATLKLFVNSVTTGGSFSVNYVKGPWFENGLTGELAPPVGDTIASNVLVGVEAKNQYILINITPAVEAWLGGEPNYGIALVGNGAFSASFDSKENTATGHAPQLDVVLATAGNLQWNGKDLICAPSAAADGSKNASIACGAGSGVTPGTITGVTAGIDLTGGGTSGNVTLNVDTTKVPQLATANTFTGNQTVNGNLTATGIVSAGSFEIGSNLFAFGSYANANAFLGFSGNTTTTGLYNAANGYQALSANTTAWGNTATGFQALSRNTSGSYNTATGMGALSSNTTGQQNTANGSSALFANTTGSYNTADGIYALTNNTTGGDNTAIGMDALAENTTGYSNTAVGLMSLEANTSGFDNTAVGLSALLFNTTGFSNTATGFQALYSNTTASGNTADGFAALDYDTTGSNNTAVGTEALEWNTIGADNTANGAYALYQNTSGPYNTATGYEALFSNTTANYNTANGTQAMYSNTTGEANLADGALALYSNTTGAGNTGVGANALRSNTTSNYVTCVGYYCSVSDGISNATAIGARAIVEQSNSLVLGGTNENAVNVGIGTTKPSNILTVARGAGHPVSDSWETYSSRRWKTNIKTLPDALSRVEQLRGVSYELKDSGKHEIGVIAEEVGQVVPEIVSFDKNGKDANGVDYSRLTALLIEAVKQQQRQIAAQQKLIRKQQHQIAGLSHKVGALESSFRIDSRQAAAVVASR